MPSSRDNFVRLAEARTNKVLKDLDLLGNLSNKSNYSFSEDDVKAIFRVLSKKIHEIELRFRASMQVTKDNSFRLPK